MATSQNPPAHSATLLTARGSHGAALPHFFVERYLDSYIFQWEAFCNYARSGGPSPVSAADGRAPLAVGMAAWRSVREGRPVEV